MSLSRLHLPKSLASLPSRIGRRELAILAAILAPAGLLYLFMQIVEEVGEGDTMVIDRAVLLALRNPADLADPIGPWWVEVMFKDLTSLGSTTVLMLVTLAAIGFLLITRRRGAALLVLVAVGGGTLLSSLFKQAFARPRPDFVAHAVDVHTASFPSGHAMLSAVTYLTLGALLARVEPHPMRKAYILGLAVALALAIGISRVFLGVHYPTDVLAGWSVGAAWAMLCWGVAWWLQRRGQVESDSSAQVRREGTS